MTRRPKILALLVLLALAAGSFLVVRATYRKGERITREPFEEE